MRQTLRNTTTFDPLSDGAVCIFLIFRFIHCVQMFKNYHSRFVIILFPFWLSIYLCFSIWISVGSFFKISEFFKSSSNRPLMDRIFSSKANLIFRHVSTALWLDLNSHRNNILNSFVSQKIVKLIQKKIITQRKYIRSQNMLNKIDCYSKIGNFIWLKCNSCFFQHFDENRDNMRFNQCISR